MDVTGYDVNPTHVWLTVSALFFVVEITITGGIGLVFAGLAALATALLLYLNILLPDAILMQMAVWLALTTVFGALLWKPLKRWRLNPESKEDVSNLVGDTVTVTNGHLVKGIIGRAKWSGTIMHAELDPNADVEELPEGTLATIVDMNGTTLIVTPRH